MFLQVPNLTNRTYKLKSSLLSSVASFTYSSSFSPLDVCTCQPSNGPGGPTFSEKCSERLSSYFGISLTHFLSARLSGVRFHRDFGNRIITDMLQYTLL